MKTKRVVADSSSIALEEESRKMEERLHVLRKMMSVEKASRELAAGSYFWKSSQTSSDFPSPSTRSTTGAGPIVDRDSLNRGKKKRVVRILKNKGNEDPLLSKKCGQCEKPSAKLVCIECVENYCLSCFAKFHQKGALSKHRVKPIKVKAPSTKTVPMLGSTTTSQSSSKMCETRDVGCASQTPVPQRSVDSSVGTIGSIETAEGEARNETCAAGGGGSLWEGEYDEKASAQSFQEALTEWRAESTGTTTKPTVSHATQACTTQTVTEFLSPQVTLSSMKSNEVNFSKYSGGVSYLEKLMVRRHRTNPHFLSHTHCKPSQDCRGETGDGLCCSEKDGELETVPSKYNPFHSSKEVGANNMELYSYTSLTSTTFHIPFEFTETAPPFRPASSVQIEELKFPDAPHSDETSQLSQSGEKKCVKQKGERENKMHTSQQKEKLRPLTQENKSISNSAKKKVDRDYSDTTKKCTNMAEDCKSLNQTCSTSVRQALQAHTKIGRATLGRKLSSFFLSGVEGNDAIREEIAADRMERDESSAYKSSKPILPISATIWLPGNSVLAEEECSRQGDHYPPTPEPHASQLPPSSSPGSDRRLNPLLTYSSLNSSPPTCLNASRRNLSPPPPDPSCNDNHCNPLLATSNYNIETNLPPQCPSCTFRTKANVQIQSSYDNALQAQLSSTSHCPTILYGQEATSLYKDSDAESNDTDILGAGYLSGGEGWAELEYGNDAETLENLAWELQSVTSGRLTQCEEEEKGEGEGRVDLEEEIERVKSSFEMYHQQIMQQDSD